MENEIDFQFDLIRHHGDYIEFSLSYRIEYNKWSAEGIGWVSESIPLYYLRTLRLNNYPAASHYNKKAKIGLYAQSVIFQSKSLDRLLLAQISHHMKHPPKAAK